MWTAEIQILNEEWLSQKLFQFKQLQINPKKNFPDFKGIRTMASSPLALRCSAIWAMKTHTMGAGQFVEFILQQPLRRSYLH